jgi:hypothetical protein
VIFCRWTRSSMPLRVEDLRANPMLTDEDVKLLGTAGIRGHLNVTGAGIHGSGAQARAIVLLNTPLEKPTILKQPHATSVVYVQEKEAFVSYPPNTNFIERGIELRPDRAPGPIVYYMVELVSGARQGGTAVFWRDDRRSEVSETRPNIALEPTAFNHSLLIAVLGRRGSAPRR